MTVEKEKEGGRLTVFIKGSLDAAAAPVLKEALEGELTDINELYFDMQEMDYASSVGLRVILGAYQEIEDRGRMVLRHMNGEVKEIFRLTGFLNFLEVED